MGAGMSERKDENSDSLFNPDLDRNDDGPTGPSQVHEKIDPDAYLHKYPELAGEIKNLFNALTFLPDFDSPDETDTDKTVSREFIIGDYRLLQLISSGGMGRVFEAEQISLGRRVALKILSPHLSISHKAVLKFRREAGAAGRQNHPGIVTIFEVGEIAGVHYIAQEFIESGSTLADHMAEAAERGDPAPAYFKNMAGIIAFVAEALAHAHRSGVTHRDVKPANILLTFQGIPKLTDFGLAKVEDGLALSRSGEFSGTPYYVSPEQADIEPVEIDHRTDIYSLGVTLYEVLCFKRPFEGSSAREILRRILIRDPVPPRTIQPSTPRDLEIICLKAMEKKPIHRYQTMDEMAEDLRRFLAGKPITAKPLSLLHRSARWIRRHKLLSLTTAAVFIAFVSTAMFLNAVIEKREEEKRLLLESFVPGKDALGWEKVGRFANPWEWFTWADSGDPGRYLLQAVFAMDCGSLEEASKYLEACLPRCRVRGETEMERDVFYLQSAVKSRLAADVSNHLHREELFKSAREDFYRAGNSDTLTNESLILRSDEVTLFDENMEGSFSPPSIRVNAHHFLIHLYRGLDLFQILYRGGERIEFETAIQHFQTVLKMRPHNVAALGYLGRVEYFFARSFNYPKLLESAEKRLHEAIELSGDRPYHLFLTTIGQIALYQGNYDKAVFYFQRAVDQTWGDRYHIHNAYCGLGHVHAAHGRVEEARNCYAESLEFVSKDSNVNVALAELCMAEGKYDEALSFAKEALSFEEGGLIFEAEMASAYLACLRACFGMNRFKDIHIDVRKLQRVAVYCPRDLAQSVFVLATFPEELTPAPNLTIEHMVSSLADQAFFMNEDSPVCLSAEGVSAWVSGRYDEAIERFRVAEKEREK
ncbi:MAG: protein kinase, partial [Planctomycetes bacterium]|nr:protein kinase [Planctomycetota bacterium]